MNNRFGLSPLTVPVAVFLLALVFVASPLTLHAAQDSADGDVPLADQIEREKAQVLADANSGNADAQYRLAELERFERTVGLGAGADAMVWYGRAADQGHTDAQITLARIYIDGDGVRQDYVLAGEWYRKAADQGNAVAQIGLGDLYRQGLGFPQDYESAALWYRRAADAGNALAQYDLADLYIDGNGVPRDLVQAHMWLDLAAGKWPSDQVNLVAQIRDWIEQGMTEAEIEESESLARDWEPR
jgi:hypothetical protein